MARELHGVRPEVVRSALRRISAARRAPGNQVRLFNAQENWANAFALQALILFLW